MFRTFARLSLFGLVVVMMNSPAAAFTKVPLQGTRTKEYIKDLCKHFSYQEGQGQYGCMGNCGDPKLASDACGINCDEKTNKCYGWSPSTNLSSQTQPTDILHPPAVAKASGK